MKPTATFTKLQQALDVLWKNAPERCEKEGFPKTVAGLDAWQVLCLKSALGLYQHS